MSRVALSIRLTRAQDAALRQYADAIGIPRYQAALRVMEAGLAASLTRTDPAHDDGAESLALLGEVAARLARLERLADRNLFVTASAYVYARRAGLRGEAEPARTDQAMADAAGEAYRRQRDLARGDS